MSVQLIAKATLKLNDEGFDCHFNSRAGGAKCFTVFSGCHLILMFNNFIDHDKETFEHRLTLLAETGLNGKWFGISR